MPAPKGKGLALIFGAPSKRAKSEEEDEEETSGVEAEQAATDLMDAIEAKDAAGVVAAFRALSMAEG